MATVGTGKYTYDVIENWGKLPAGDTFGMVSAIATDSQDRVYAFQRKDQILRGKRAEEQEVPLVHGPALYRRP